MNDVVNKKEKTLAGRREPATGDTPMEACAGQRGGGGDAVRDISEFLTRRKHGRTGFFLPSGFEGGD
jgi:hypothetical protein